MKLTFRARTGLMALAATGILSVSHSSTAQAQEPVIVRQPQSRTITATIPVELIVEVRGQPPLSYRWRENGTELSGETNASLLVIPAPTLEMHSYDVVVGNALGAVTSVVATVKVNPLGPGIITEPLDLFACPGESNGFYVASELADTFQWQRFGTNLPGATQPRLDFPSIAFADAGPYRVVLSNVFGFSATSQAATLTVGPPEPIITYHPENARVDYGTWAQFIVHVFSCAPYTFQWRFNGQDLEGEQNNYLLREANDETAGVYDVVIEADGLSLTSHVAYLEVVRVGPVIARQPTSQTVYLGNRASFSAVATGLPTPAYQWHHNGVPVAGATGTSFAFDTISTNQAGQYTVVASNFLGAVTSQVAHLTIQVVPPVFDQHPVSEDVAAGEAVRFYAGFTSYSPTRIEWFHNGQLESTNLWQLFIEPTSIDDVGNYYAVATSASGSTTSQVARLTIHEEGPLDRWVWRRPLPQGNDLQDIAFGNGQWVAVGRLGLRLVSNDGGETWQNHRFGALDRYRIAYGNNRFVAVSLDNDANQTALPVQVSFNGTDWSRIKLPVVCNNDPGIAFGNGRFVVLGSERGTLTSTDGISWELHAVSPPFGAHNLRFLNGLFIALCWDGIRVSTDGESWARWNLSSAYSYADIAYGNGIYAVCGRDPARPNQILVLTSPDGASWAPSTIPSVITNSWRYMSAQAIGFGSGRFVVAGGDYDLLGGIEIGVLASSVDGLNWTNHGTNTIGELYDVEFSDARFMVVGNWGNLLTSSNGTDWRVLSGGSGLNFRCVEYGNGTYVAVGNEGVLLSSSDAVQWERRQSDASHNFRGVAYGNGRFVAVGERQNSVTAHLVSENGRDWTRPVSNLAGDLYAVTIGAGIFVAVGDYGSIQNSTDGIHWTNATSSTSARLNSVAYGGGLYIAVGRNATLLTSSNAVTWTRQNHPATVFLQGVACGDSVYVAAGRNGVILSSTNGTAWTLHQGTPYRDLEDVTFGGGVFMAVGERGTVLTSTNGQYWVRQSTGCWNALRSAVFANGRFIAVGNNETILQSEFHGAPRFTTAPTLAPGGFEFTCGMPFNRSHRIQYSTDLVNWIDVFLLGPGQSSYTVNDPAYRSISRRFYRVVSP